MTAAGSRQRPVQPSSHIWIQSSTLHTRSATSKIACVCCSAFTSTQESWHHQNSAQYEYHRALLSLSSLPIWAGSHAKCNHQHQEVSCQCHFNLSPPPLEKLHARQAGIVWSHICLHRKAQLADSISICRSQLHMVLTSMQPQRPTSDFEH